MPPDPRFKTGARPTPRYKLLRAAPYRVGETPPAQFAIVPSHLDMWGNDTHGDCVTAEEAFAKACYSPEIFIPTSEVVSWAQTHGWAEGADLVEVMDAMTQGSGGFQVGAQYYDDGPHVGVDYSNEVTLQSAISQGPVKIGIASSCLPSTAGRQQGWYSLGPQHNGGEDHCVALCGYGSADWLYAQLSVARPSAVQPSQPGYLLYTWSTIGIVDHAWIMAACAEAWLRQPTTVGVPPLGPTPTPPPGPTPMPPVRS